MDIESYFQIRVCTQNIGFAVSCAGLAAELAVN